MPRMHFHFKFMQFAKWGVISGWGNVKNHEQLTDTLAKIRFQFAPVARCRNNKSSRINGPIKVFSLFYFYNMHAFMCFKLILLILEL